MFYIFKKYILGEAHILAYNGIVNRLINLLAKNNIPLKNIKATDEGFEAGISSIDIFALKHYAKKVNVDIKILSKKGYFFRKFKKRYGFIVGIVLFFLCFNVSKNYIWDINISNVEGVNPIEIEKCLEELGIKRFSKISDIDFYKKKQEALLKLPSLSWISLNIKGSRLYVNSSKKVNPPDIQDNKVCNIIASDTGYIRYIDVYNGECVAHKNTTVSEGDLLVAGTFYDKRNNLICVHSDAIIIATVLKEKTISLDLNMLQKKYSGETKVRRYIEIYGLKIPLFISFNKNENYDFTEEKIGLKNLPINIIVEKMNFYEKSFEEIELKKAKEILEKEFYNYENINFRDSLILDKKVSMKLKDNIFYMTCNYKLEKDICQKVAL